MIKSERIGNAIEKAFSGEFDVIVQGCNCFSTQKKGFAILMSQTFLTDKFPMENSEEHLNKLGCIDYQIKSIGDGKEIIVCNMYTQYHWANPSRYGIPLDYDALRLCFRKLNKAFKNQKVIVPGLIGCGNAKGKPSIVKQIINEECYETEVHIFYPEDYGK